MKKLPSLYKKTGGGADQVWTIFTEGNTIYTRWGQYGGKIQDSMDVISEGKNIGKANETTPEQQAQAEAQSQWEKKLKKGYVQSLEDARAGIVDAVIEGGIVPMTAKIYADQADNVTWPNVYAQPKLDGHRCIAVVKNGKCSLWSRSRKQITSVPHITAAIEEEFEKQDIILDGELYNENYHDKFEELTHFIRQETPLEGCEIVQYHIYDVAGPGKFSERYYAIGEKLGFKSEYLHLVRTVPVQDEVELMEFFGECINSGFEGCMVRNADSPYINKRSPNLLKVKEFIDDEFIVIGVEEGRGKLAGCGIFVCKTKDGAEFRAKMMGDSEKLKDYWKHASKYIGKQLTVKFQGYTNKSSVPRFPVGVRFRKDI